MDKEPDTFENIIKVEEDNMGVQRISKIRNFCCENISHV